MRIWPKVAALALGFGLLGCGGSDALEDDDGDAQVLTPDPVFVEHYPGELLITSPPRGAFIPVEAGNVVTVVGSGATKDLTVNGLPVAPTPDGSFTTDVVLGTGLNLIRVVNGESSVDTPVVFGAFAPVEQAVPSAVTVRVNRRGFANPDTSVVSLELLANRALDDYDILATLQGQVFSGSVPGGSWTLQVTGASYTGTDVEVAPESGGAAFTAMVHGVQVHGQLTIDILFSKTDSVTISADAVRVDGIINAGLQGSSLAASGAWANTNVQGFGYSSGNAGLPCCVDSILTGYLKPKVEDAIQEQVQGLMSQELAFALEQFSLPASIDLSAAGLPTTLGIQTYLDGASFEADGVTLSAAANFMSPLQPGQIGELAPGWITIAQPMAAPPLDPSFGVSVSLDALNQALHAVWAQNGLMRRLEGLPMVDIVDVEPRLPPMVLPNGNGGLSARAGEIVLHTSFNDVPIQAALSVIDDVYLQLDPVTQQLQLVPGPEPIVSVTWLQSEGLADGVRKLIKSSIIDMIPTLLTPVSMPLPTLPLGVITPSFNGSMGALSPSTQLVIAGDTARMNLYGDLAIVPAM
jgi:hypothetical protein